MLEIPKDDDLLVRSAWLYYVGGQSQEEVGQALGISRFRVTRMLAEARERGIVRIAIEHDTTATLEAADRLIANYGLRGCIVTPRLGVDPGRPSSEAEEEVARRAVGIAAAGLLSRKLQKEGPVTVGIGLGRTIARMAEALSGVRKKDVRFVSLVGSLTRTAKANPFDVCIQLATSCGGEAYFLAAPYLVDSEADYSVIMSQRIVRETLEVARSADIYFVGCGECREGSTLYSSGLVTADEFASLAASGAVVDSTGKFFDAKGRLVPSDLNNRTISVTMDDLHEHEVVLLAAGRIKAEPVRAMLATGFVDQLVVDGDLADLLM
ncbi:Transcriptional regulator LsrR [Hartmannibacter diazotrophicus]|uniref:Transcriptional regulator LsrR n=1 Tax=Hartmannibacter diazotrophicus TaxID=1482074 RepID=A0A2C9DE98_9HYPH|nr:sugar-binding transcriptional regulator [Hartmannibacter diazotrophicus]SON58221.1 Transcriptional regulator LsrR [Hartmannibacter diazotrophicus]